jgi:two-component system phosphate regulon sensor histidine kinase PhoR
MNFEYGIFSCDNDSIIYGNKVDLKNYTTANQVDFVPQADQNFYFGVLFPGKTSYIAEQLKVWIGFSILLFMVILFFSYALFVIFKQKKLSEIKTDFINNMTHELKTPLSTISASSEVLMKSKNNTPERVATYAAIINQESIRLKQQIESVLKISVIDSKKLSLKKEDLDIHAIVQSVIDTFKPIIEVQHGTIGADFVSENIIISGDKNHLENVFHNLIENAIKYCRDDLKISVKTFIKDQFVVIQVTDNGVGIPQNMQLKIFEKFFRVPTGDVHNVKGFGIGLYYVKKIIEAHQGKISVESKLEEGTTFCVELPIKS